MKKQDSDLLLKMMLKEHEIECSLSYARFLYVYSSQVKSPELEYYEMFLLTELLAEKTSFDSIVRPLSLEASKELHSAYAKSLTFFLDNDILAKKFKLDESDETGWKIYKLMEKRRELISDYVQVKHYGEHYYANRQDS